MFFTLYEIFILSFKFNEVVSGVMNSKVDEFLSCLNNEIENKTDKYWLEQVVFEIGDDQNLNIVVNSEFIKNSIEKKVCLLYTSPSPRDQRGSRMPSSA